MSSFVRQTSFNVEYGSAEITKWYSSTTGLQVIHNNQPSPVVKGTFVVGTELTDDSGVSAALERLVFMGSEKYPYRGLIKKLESRFMAQTTSSTQTDHTRYELSTVGWGSFKTLLPIFFEHLFHPTLTNEAFLTQVYHIDSVGEEMGKQYLHLEEIRPQTREHSSYHLRKNMFTAGSPYAFSADGVLSEIRELKNSQVRDFHKEVYRPSNVCLIVTGSIDEEEFLSILSDIDTQLLPLFGCVKRRPFEDSTQDLLLSENILKTVEFPSPYTIAGVTATGWIGPECSNHIDKEALDMIGSYLTECFETDLDNVSCVCYLTNNYVRKTMSFDYLSTGDLQQPNQKLKQLLAQLADSQSIDLTKITRIATEKEKRFRSESASRQQMFVDFAIVDFLYGTPDGSTLSSWATYHEIFAKLASWSVQQWSDLIQTYFVNSHSATILCVPSEKLEEERNKAEITRLEGIKERYGENGLRELNETMRAVKETPIPDELLASFGKPDPAKIVFSKSQSYAAGSNDGSLFDYEHSGVAADIIAQDQPKNFPLYLHFENITSPTTLVNLMISTTTLPPQLLKYSQLFRQIFSVSFTRLPSGEYAPCEETHPKEADTISYSLVNSGYYRFGELLNVKFTFKHADYTDSIHSLIKLFKHSVFEESRVQETIADILECVEEEKADHDLVMKSLQVCTLYSDASFRKASDWMNIEQFYNSLLQQIKDGGFSLIKKDLESIRTHLFNVSNMKVFVIGQVNSLAHPVSSWASFVDAFSSQPNTSSWSLTEAPAPFQYKTPVAEKCAHKAFFTTHPASCTEVRSLTPIPTDHLHEDSYKIALACEFLKRCHCISVSCDYMNKSSEAGYLSLSFFAFSARLTWDKTKQMIADFATGKRQISENNIHMTIIHIVRELAAIKTERELALSKVAYTIFKNRGPDYLSHYLAKINTYTSKDLVYVMKKYFVGLFDSEKSLVFTRTQEDKVDDFSKFLSSQGYDVSMTSFNIPQDRWGCSCFYECDNSDCSSQDSIDMYG